MKQLGPLITILKIPACSRAQLAAVVNLIDFFRILYPIATYMSTMALKGSYKST